jgi:multimeric flavodoxin WrbA
MNFHVKEIFMKKVLAINGSYRKNKTIDTLIDKAIAGIKSIDGSAEIEKIHLTDKEIQYCKGCMTCFNDDPSKSVARCVIDDDMKELCVKLDQADAYIFGTPIFMGTITAIMKTFCERFCWTLSKPGNKPIKGCPTPRTDRKKTAIIVMSASIVPTLFRMFCDDATKFFKENLPCMLNAKVIGSLYAGKVGIGKTDPGAYFTKASDLGKKLGQTLL